jgi:hypothetical protein
VWQREIKRHHLERTTSGMRDPPKEEPGGLGLGLDRSQSNPSEVTTRDRMVVLDTRPNRTDMCGSMEHKFGSVGHCVQVRQVHQVRHVRHVRHVRQVRPVRPTASGCVRLRPAASDCVHFKGGCVFTFHSQ